EAVPKSARGDGQILIRVREEDAAVIVEVEDNGKGLPTAGRDSLLEPYMTTREKGTGLGLAIVQKIMEEHEGTITLLDRQAGEPGQTGACVRLTFPKNPGHDSKPATQLPATSGANITSAGPTTGQDPGEQVPGEQKSGEQQDNDKIADSGPESGSATKTRNDITSV
ncbi:MAG: ATP-binding protein, partial [Alphaproteobacteria bacterium]